MSLPRFTHAAAISLIALSTALAVPSLSYAQGKGGPGGGGNMPSKGMGQMDKSQSGMHSGMMEHDRTRDRLDNAMSQRGMQMQSTMGQMGTSQTMRDRLKLMDQEMDMMRDQLRDMQRLMDRPGAGKGTMEGMHMQQMSEHMNQMTQQMQEMHQEMVQQQTQEQSGQ